MKIFNIWSTNALDHNQPPKESICACVGWYTFHNAEALPTGTTGVGLDPSPVSVGLDGGLGLSNSGSVLGPGLVQIFVSASINSCVIWEGSISGCACVASPVVGCVSVRLETSGIATGTYTYSLVVPSG